MNLRKQEKQFTFKSKMGDVLYAKTNATKYSIYYE